MLLVEAVELFFRNLPILRTMKHRHDRYQIIRIVDFVHENVWQSGYHPLIGTRRAPHMAHMRETSKPVGTFQNSLDDRISRARPIFGDPCGNPVEVVVRGLTDNHSHLMHAAAQNAPALLAA
jgi:hypothetical protein